MAELVSQSQSTPRRRGVIAVVTREGRFLAICRSQQVVAPGALCFPGGGIEADESEAQAVVREFREELGAAIEPARCVFRSTTSLGTELAWWTCSLEVAADLVPNPLEVASHAWLTSQEMLDHEQLLESNREFLAALAAGQITLD